jgi:hypothetical protein
MPNNAALIKEFEAVRAKYYELLAALIKAGVPGIGVIDKVASKCDVGEVCHGGSFRNPLDTGDPAPRPAD